MTTANPQTKKADDVARVDHSCERTCRKDAQALANEHSGADQPQGSTAHIRSNASHERGTRYDIECDSKPGQSP